MARVVFDHPERHVGRRLGRALAVVAGGALALVGLVASVVAVPATFVVVGLVLERLTGEHDSPDSATSDLPVEELVLAFAISAPLAVFGLRYGLRLVRGRRELVLFLRRFGYDHATEVVTYAAAETIGATWRLVTLDDAEIAPVGLPGGRRRAFAVGGAVARTVSRAVQVVLQRVLPFAIVGMFATGALAVLREEPWVEGRESSVDAYEDVLTSLLERSVPLDALGFDLLGAFALAAIVVAFGLVLLLVTFVVLLASFPLAAPLLFLSSSADAVREAERGKAVEIGDRSEVGNVAYALTKAKGRVFAPRLVVVRVASEIWQEAVLGLADVASAPLVDVSEPTDNVVWELEELLRRFGDACVLVGHHERVAELATPAPGSAAAEVARLIEGREVLAYVPDRAGKRRFARALRARLLSLAEDASGARGRA